MEQKCKYIEKIERNNRRKNIGIIIILCIIMIAVLINIHKSKLEVFFVNAEGKFDINILWTFIGSIGSILAFIGVIITIIFTEKSRKKQNKYDYEKQRLIEEQFEFKKELKKILEILDPSRVLMFDYITKENYQIIQKQLDNYIIEIKTIDYKIYWYYNREFIQKSTILNKFMQELNKFIEDIKSGIFEYNIELEKIGKIKMYETYEFFEKLNKLNKEDIEEYNKLQYEKSKELLEYDKIINNLSNIKLKIVDYRNENWSRIVEEVKLLIEERENILKDNLKI